MKTGHVFRTAVTGRVDTDAMKATTQASNQKGRPASWPQASKDRSGISTSDSLTTVPAPTNDAFADAIRKQQEFNSTKGK